MLLSELAGVLRRDRFRRYLSQEEAHAYVAELVERAEPWDDPSDRPSVSPDPEDDYLVALARASDADALVSGDVDLTGLQLPNLSVIDPRQLVDDFAHP